MKLGWTGWHERVSTSRSCVAKHGQRSLLIIDQQMEETFVINLIDSSDADISLSLTKKKEKIIKERTERKINNYKKSWKTYDKDRK